MKQYAIKRMADGKTHQPSDPTITTFNAEVAAQNRLDAILTPAQQIEYYIAPIDV